MPSVAELELAMRVSKDPSVRLGDLQDTVWEESIQGLHVMKFRMLISSGGGPQLIPISVLISNPKIVLLQINKEAGVRVGSAGATPVEIEIIGRYGYFVITAGTAGSLYVEPSEDAEVVVCAIGD